MISMVTIEFQKSLPMVQERVKKLEHDFVLAKKTLDHAMMVLQQFELEIEERTRVFLIR